jgi:hypothetical protein
VLGLDEQDHANWLEREFAGRDSQHFGGDVEFGRRDRARGVKLALYADEVRRGGPGEIVDVFLVETVGRAFGLGVTVALLDAGRRSRTRMGRRFPSATHRASA